MSKELVVKIIKLGPYFFLVDSPLAASKYLTSLTRNLTRNVGHSPLHVVPAVSQVGLRSTPLVHNPGGQPALEVEQRVVDTGKMNVVLSTAC